MSKIGFYGSAVAVALVTVLSGLVSTPADAQRDVDILAFFETARGAGRVGVARKTKLVDVRAAKPGEIVVTIIKGEGKETQSPPAEAGDMVVRNRCPESGNEEILIVAAKFGSRYEGPIGAAGADGWLPYRPRGVEMRFVLLTAEDGALSFTAPWGEKMIARVGDAIVQDINNTKDTYRIQRAAFACTYEVLSSPKP